MKDAMPPVAIVNCDVLTPSRRISRGLVWVEGGVIRAVGRSQDVSLPVEAQLIDARGGFITPGLIDLAWSGQEQSAPEAFAVTSVAPVVRVGSEDDLPLLAQAAEDLSRPSFDARPVGLHVALGSGAPVWDDLWTAADAAIALVTLSPTQLGAPDLLRHLLLARIPCFFDWQDLPQPPEDPLLYEMLLCGLAAVMTPPAVIAGVSAPRIVALPADVPTLLPALDWESLLLIGSRDQPLRGRELFALSKQVHVDFPLVLAAASIQPARFLRLAQGRLAAGAPADLLCWTRFGEPAWAMVGGQVVP